MMETITIPSPSAFLSSPVPQPAKVPPLATTKRKPTSTKVSESASKKRTGVAKPKQSKSRNGCITCKAKRLKCDETKPSCAQCHKRSVTCGGYKKDFKWRPFEETTFTNKVTPPRAKRSSISTIKQLPDQVGSPSPSDASSNHSPDAEADMAVQDTFFNAAVTSPPMTQLQDPAFSESQFHPNIPFDMSTPPYLRNPPRRHLEPNSVTRPLDSLFDDPGLVPTTTGRSSMSGQSPRLIDLLLPGSPLNAPSSSQPLDHRLMPLPPFLYQPGPIMHDGLPDEDVEEIIRQPSNDNDMWLSSLGTPLDLRIGRSSSSPTITSSTMTHSSSPTFTQFDHFPRITPQPSVQAGSPEVLMLRFDKQTCGILSVKDGPTENPWRTLIWPLARDSPALYHAIASMTAFHTSREKPALRVDGMEHMRQSIKNLARGIEGGMEEMRTDTALATTLVLAFSESWDQHISTGIEHLRGAKILMNQAIASHSRNRLEGEDLARLKFLANTWVYMDVIARLTSSSFSPDTDFSTVLSPLFGPNSFLPLAQDQSQSDLEYEDMSEIDPLMGCASTLFPLIGRVASLCRRVRSMASNSVTIISQAIELQSAIQAWTPSPSSSYPNPEDPSADVQHALQTAEAYRFATLLYLHQAVPEIPSLSSAVLAKKVLVFLATVPLSSRLVIVQIYPLLAAGCECEAEGAEGEEGDREWVLERWRMMEKRMWIGNLEKCADVTKEVWRRRDEWEAHNQARIQDANSRRATLVNSENNKRRFEEEMEMGEDFLSFEEMLHGSTLGAIPPRRQRGSMSGKGSEKGKSSNATNIASGARERDRDYEMVADEMDREYTVRGTLHWVSVMKDWEWEILLG